MKFYKIVFMGTPEFAVPVLSRLIKDGHDVVGVVTQPDRKRGRGKAVTFSPVKELALKHDLKILQPARIKSSRAIDDLYDLGADLFITCAYGQILSQAVLDIPKEGCINVHASLLPKYRGAAPIHRAVLNGDTETGITTMMTDIGMDTGDMLLKKRVAIGPDTTTGELHDILMETGADLISDTLRQLAEGTLLRIPQDNTLATHAPMLKKEESIVDWEEDAESIHNRVRALNPWPGCFTSYEGRRMRLIKSGWTESGTNHEPGTITDINKEYICIACQKGQLHIYRLQFENGKAMDVSQCWHNIEKGTVLGRR